MFTSIRIRLDQRKKRMQWREANAHNDTHIPVPLFCPGCVTVGKGTYGAICVEMARKDRRLIIGNYCSIANGVNFILSSEHRTNLVSTFPFKVKQLFKRGR